MKNRIVRDFKDEKGEVSKMIVESDDNMSLNMNGSYKLAYKGKGSFLKKHKNMFTEDIGLKSAGFTRVATLALFISVAALVVMYFIFRF